LKKRDGKYVFPLFFMIRACSHTLWIAANQCWFCLSNPSLEKHLLVTIGEDVYLALAKGGLVEWGGHLLIVPIGHVESTRHLQLSAESEDTQNIIKEMQALKEQVQAVYTQRGERMISFEMYGGDQGQGTPLQHMHIQLIPVPVEVTSDIQAVFEQEAEREGLELAPDGTLPESLTVPYCRVEVPSLHKDTAKSPLVMVFVPSQDRMREFKALEDECLASGRRPPRLVNLAFGRAVVAQILGAPDKADWRKCLQTMEEEQAATLSIRALLSSASTTTE
jgi:hypothetical protein